MLTVIAFATGATGATNLRSEDLLGLFLFLFITNIITNQPCQLSITHNHKVTQELGMDSLFPFHNSGFESSWGEGKGLRFVVLSLTISISPLPASRRGLLILYFTVGVSEKEEI